MTPSASGDTPDARDVLREAETAIEAWLGEQEGFSVKSERLYDDLNDDVRLAKVWLIAAFELGRRSSLSASTAAPEAEGWRDISTVPKDGTEVDLWVVWPDRGGARYPDCHFQPEKNDWWLGQYWLGQSISNPQPTHWRPVPPGPASPSRASQAEAAHKGWQDFQRLIAEARTERGSAHLSDQAIANAVRDAFDATPAVSSASQAGEHLYPRLAFKAGWRTNADKSGDPEYLDGCERVDWEEFQARGLTAYLDALNDSTDETCGNCRWCFGPIFLHCGCKSSEFYDSMVMPDGGCSHFARVAPQADTEEKTLAQPCGLADPGYQDCKNMVEVGGGMEGERYRCAVCGKSYFLDYEDMK